MKKSWSMQWFERIQVSMRIERDMICFSFVDRFGTFWIPAVAGVIFYFIFEDVLNKSYNCFRIIFFPVCKNRDWHNGSNIFKFWWESKEIWSVLRSSMNLIFFEFQQQHFDFKFLSMNGECLKIEVTKWYFEFFLNTFHDIF
jgi:hypothetical protein